MMPHRVRTRVVGGGKPKLAGAALKGNESDESVVVTTVAFWYTTFVQEYKEKFNKLHNYCLFSFEFCTFQRERVRCIVARKRAKKFWLHEPKMADHRCIYRVQSTLGR